MVNVSFVLPLLTLQYNDDDDPNTKTISPLFISFWLLIFLGVREFHVGKPNWF
jgi:hypothetical protein